MFRGTRGIAYAQRCKSVLTARKALLSLGEDRVRLSALEGGCSMPPVPFDGGVGSLRARCGRCWPLTGVLCAAGMAADDMWTSRRDGALCLRSPRL